MRRPLVILLCLLGALAALGVLLQTPGSLSVALVQPLHALLGTQQTLNSTLLEVSESAEPVRSAGRRLLKPLGVVRLVTIYNPSDAGSEKKR